MSFIKSLVDYLNKPIYFSRRREVSQPRETSPSRIEVTTNIPAAEVRGEDTSPRVEITQEERKIDPSPIISAKTISGDNPIPIVNTRRIYGTENEYGCVNNGDWIKNPMGDTFLANGGRLYADCGHVEYASPETNNPLEAVIFEKAGELIAPGFYSGTLYKNNVDSLENTFGAHENYFTKISRDASSFAQLLPFLITRQIFAGAGNIFQGKYQIAQRSRFMEAAIANSTISGRGVINTRDGHLADISGWHRLHLIVGDANMCEGALFLKLGTTGLVLDLMEDGRLPSLEYDSSCAVKDIRDISTHLKKWKVSGARGTPLAPEIQRMYANAAKEFYSGRDSVTDKVLEMWGDTLDRLEEDPRSLIGRVDWVTKKALIDQYAKKHNLELSDPRLLNIDLQYHDLNRSTSLFYRLQDNGKIERVATDEQILYAVDNPPATTRAFARGLTVKARPTTLARKEGIKGAKVDWNNMVLYEIRTNEEGLYQHTVRSSALNDPFQIYEEEALEAQKHLRGGNGG